MKRQGTQSKHFEEPVKNRKLVIVYETSLPTKQEITQEEDKMETHSYLKPVGKCL